MDDYVRGKAFNIFESFLNLPRRLLLHGSLETGFLTMLAFAAVIYISPPLRLGRNPQLLLWWLWAICVPGFLALWDFARGTHLISVTRYILLASPAIYAIFATPFATRIGKLVPAAFVFAAAMSAFARWQAGPQPTPDIRTAAHWIAADVPPRQLIILLGGPDYEPSFNYFAVAHYTGEWHRPVVLLQSPADANLQPTLAQYQPVWVWGRIGADPGILPGWKLTPEQGFRSVQGQSGAAKSPPIPLNAAVPGNPR
jgi:hypothetical protein